MVIAIVGVAAFYYGQHSKHNQSARTATKQVAVASPNASSATAPTLPDAKFLSGNTYLDSPQKLGDLGFMKDYKALGCDTNCNPADLNVSYYQIGSTAKGQKIVVMTYLSGPGGDGYVYTIETQPGAYNVLAQNSYDLANFASNWQPSLASNVTIDEKTKIDDIKMPLQVTVGGQKIKVQFAPDGAQNLSMSDFNLMKDGLASIRGGYFSEVGQSDVKKIGSQNNIDFYEVTAKDTDNYKVVELHGAYKQLFSARYDTVGEITSATNALKINWSGGASNVSEYFSAGQGCGSTGYVVAKNVSSGDLTKAGTTPGGQTVYQLPKSNPLVQEMYSKDYASGENLDDQSLKNLTIDQFTQKHGYFLAQNGLGEYVLFLRSDLIIRGGCAKPVVYLYPQHQEQVSVKVGANVVNSAPTYGSGWENVTAMPDGKLSYKGKPYDSLFWDGYGYGAYPDINSGTIVKTSKVAQAVKQQLASQGLNSREIGDFMAYWQPKFAAISKPYTRLTWFNTAQMNALAPLQVSPRPQSMLRVFLDFEGLDKPYNLAAQHLSATARNGFTLVEWGGLARDGLN